MNDNNWNGIMKVLEIKHWRNDKIIWERRNIKNLLHEKGEEFILSAAFSGGKISTVIPDNYYFGLDNRSLVKADQEMDNLIGEPTGNGYTRQTISSSNEFIIGFENDHYQAVSPVLVFRASGASWGPVTNLFLTDQAGNAGSLISTAALGESVIVNDGDSITVRLTMLLKDCAV
jgi:hypothetical protein